MKTEAEEIAALREEIEAHNYLYYVTGKPVVSDEEYDALVARLAKLEAQNPALKADDSPTRKVGDDRTEGFAKAKHIAPMLSLNHTYAKAGLDDWLLKQRRETLYVVEPKIDGIAFNAVYRGGRLEKLLTRGDGREGDDITRHAKNIKGIPLLISYTRDVLELRGEIFMTSNEFEYQNSKRIREGKEPFATPRNLAAGTVKSLDEATSRERRLEAVFYGAGVNCGLFGSQKALRLTLAFNNIPIAFPARVNVERKDLWRVCKEIGDEVKRGIIPCDGVVVKVDNFAERERLGEGCRAPKWALAVKFRSPEAETTLREISYQKGRTGKITPVAIFDAVYIGGVKICRANLCTEQRVAELGLRVGDRIVVERTGDAVPKIVRVVSH